MSVFVDGHCHLDSRDTMIKVLTELTGEHAKPYRGAVMCWPVGDATGPATWRIELHDWCGTAIQATIGDHLVLTYGRLLCLSAKEYETHTS